MSILPVHQTPYIKYARLFAQHFSNLFNYSSVISDGFQFIREMSKPTICEMDKHSQQMSIKRQLTIQFVERQLPCQCPFVTFLYRIRSINHENSIWISFYIDTFQQLAHFLIIKFLKPHLHHELNRSIVFCICVWLSIRLFPSISGRINIFSISYKPPSSIWSHNQGQFECHCKRVLHRDKTRSPSIFMARFVHKAYYTIAIPSIGDTQFFHQSIIAPRLLLKWQDRITGNRKEDNLCDKVGVDLHSVVIPTEN